MAEVVDASCTTETSSLPVEQSDEEEVEELPVDVEEPPSERGSQWISEPYVRFHRGHHSPNGQDDSPLDSNEETSSGHARIVLGSPELDTPPYPPDIWHLPHRLYSNIFPRPPSTETPPPPYEEVQRTSFMRMYLKLYTRYILGAVVTFALMPCTIAIGIYLENNTAKMPFFAFVIPLLAYHLFLMKRLADKCKRLRESYSQPS